MPQFIDFKYFLISAIIGLSALSSNLLAQQNPADRLADGATALVEAPQMQVQLIANRAQTALGDELLLAVRFNPAPGWHFYWKNPGDTGLPTRIDWNTSPGITAGPLLWPAPKRANYQGFINYGYYGQTDLLTAFKIGELVGDRANLTARISWLICEDICIPGNAELTLALQTGPTPVDSIYAGEITAALAKIPSDLGQLPGQYNFGQSLSLLVDFPEPLTGLAATDFFPISKGLVNNLATPVIGLSDGSTSISIEASARPSVLPPAFGGLVQFTDNENSEPRFYEFSVTAAPGLVALESGGGTSVAFYLVLLLAFAGGLILNLMPCVLPVLSLKVMHLVQADESLAERRMEGIFYAAGVIASFLLIAGTLLALRAGGEEIGWGFQLQSPVFVACLVYLMFVLGLVLSGFFELGASLTRLGNLGQQLSGRRSSSFATGALAAVVATPCTAPFMGVAMGAALTMSTFSALVVFAALGLGLAFPFLLIAFVPAAAKILPKPGQWMVTLREILAFPIYLTVVWLLWVFGSQQGADSAALILCGLVLLAFGAWLLRLAQRGSTNPLPRILALIIFLLSALLLYGASRFQAAEESGNTVAFDAGLISAAVTNGQPVFVNLTADWCITCKVNERVALRNDRVEQLFVDKDILYIEGDWTNVDEKITVFLERFGRSGVPLYLAYLPGNPEPLVLPQILTPGIILDAYQSL